MVCFCPNRKIIFLSSYNVLNDRIDAILIDLYGFKKFTFKDDDGKLIFTDVRYKFGIYKYILSFSNESKLYNLDSFYKFTFAMNPIRRSRLSIDEVNKKVFSNSGCMDEIIIFGKTKTYGYTHLFLSHYDSCTNIKNEHKINFIGRLETFKTDMMKLLYEIFKFDTIDESNFNVDDLLVEVKYLNPEKEDPKYQKLNFIIYKHNAEDFKHYGYKLPLL